MNKNIKKLIATILAISITLCIMLFCAGCGNMTVFDTTYTFNKAIIRLPDGTIIEGACTNWRDYEDSDQIQVTIDGKTYFAHHSNVVLISG